MLWLLSSLGFSAYFSLFGGLSIWNAMFQGGFRIFLSSFFDG